MTGRSNKSINRPATRFESGTNEYWDQRGE